MACFFKWIFASFEGAFQLPLALRLLMRVLSSVGFGQHAEVAFQYPDRVLLDDPNNKAAQNGSAPWSGKDVEGAILQDSNHKQDGR